MRGWNSQEIDIYDKLESEIFSLETHLPLVILSALLSRYLGIIFHYNPLNDIAKEILRKIMMDAITGNILSRLRRFLADQIFSSKSKKENAFETTYLLLSGWTTSHFLNHVDTFSENRFIQKESLDLVITLYNILNPQEGFLYSTFQRHAKSNPKINQLVFVES